MNHHELQKWKLELATRAKKGVDFILAASILWFCMSFIWSLGVTTYTKSIWALIVGAFLLPLAYGVSKILKTDWKVKNNPLQSLGLWLHFAQLFYFPFLVFILLTLPDYFIMTYAIITGAHLCPYAWLYDDHSFVVTSGIISMGSLIIGLNVSPELMYIIPWFTAVILLVMAVYVLNFKTR